MEGTSLKLLGASIAMLGSLGAGLGLGMVFSAWLNGLARNPAAEEKFNKVGFLGFAAVELVLLLCFVVAVMLMLVV
jgi:F-type H+-transporting ATPase subunit c